MNEHTGFRRSLETIGVALLAIFLGLLASSVFVIIAGSNPVDAYQRLFCEGFGARGCETFGNLLVQTVVNEDTGESQTVFSPLHGTGGHSLALVLERATPLILTALSATVAFKAGLFSIGMDGQFVLGALAAAFLGYWFPAQLYTLFGVTDPELAPEALKTIMHIIVPAVCLGAAMMAGAFYSWIAGYLKVKLNINVLISTIILNAIAVQFVGYMVNYPLRSDMNNIARTARIDETAWLIPFNRGLFANADIEWFSGSRLGVGFIIAVVAAVLVWYFLYRTTRGYEQRMVNGSPLFARFSGIPGTHAMLRAMLISGALSGIAGAIEVIGVERRIVDGFATAGTGFDGVLVAILARESIVGILFVAPFIAGLEQGAINFQFGNLPRQLGNIIIALIILFNAMEYFLRSYIAAIWRKRHIFSGKSITPAPTEASS
ncbi:MAG: ABC transporter permease [Anaerolineae bacterium]|nr:ABC transporter permease [Anaerolineae bacterium]